MRRARQVERILAAYAKRDLEALRQLAQAPGGFILDSVRKLVWYRYACRLQPFLRPHCLIYFFCIFAGRPCYTRIMVAT